MMTPTIIRRPLSAQALQVREASVCLEMQTYITLHVVAPSDGCSLIASLITHMIYKGAQHVARVKNHRRLVSILIQYLERLGSIEPAQAMEGKDLVDKQTFDSNFTRGGNSSDRSSTSHWQCLTR